MVQGDFDEFDLILAMDKAVYRAIVKYFKDRKDKTKIQLFRQYDPEGVGSGNIHNPYYSNNYTEVYEIIERTCKNLIKLQDAG